VHIIQRMTLVVAVFILITPAAHARNHVNIGGALGALMQAAQAAEAATIRERARSEWSQVDPDLLSCLQGSLLKTPPNQLANRGISVSDARLIKYVNACYADVGPPRLGVTLGTVTYDLNDDINRILRIVHNQADEDTTDLTDEKTLIISVKPNSVAASAGLKSGDVIYKYNGHQITGNQLNNLVRVSPPQTKHEIEIFRDGGFETYYATFSSIRDRREVHNKIIAKTLAEERKIKQAKAKIKQAKEKVRLVQKERERKERVKRIAKATVLANAKAKQERNNILADSEYTQALSKLFSGNKDDIVYLVDTESDGVMKGLGGNLVIAHDIPKSCVIPLTNYSPTKNVFHREAEKSFYQVLKKEKIKRSACTQLSIEPSNIIIFSKSIKSSTSPAILKWILQKYNEGTYQTLVVADANAFVQKQLALKKENLDLLATQKKRSKSLLASVEKGQSSGYGLLILKAGDRSVCSVKGENEKVVKGIISSLHKSDPISLKGITGLEISKDTLNNNFLKLKLKKCKYFVARADKMKNLVIGLKRDKIAFSLHHELGGINQATSKRPRSQSPVRERNVSSTPVANRSVKRKTNKYAVAVIIGNKNYTDRTPQVDFSHNDADAMKKFVIDRLGYRKGNIIDLRDATQSQMMAIFGTKDSYKGKLFGWVRPGKSDVTVFYSGHGVPSLKNKRGYLLPVDADPNLVEITGYPVDVLYKNLAKINAKTVTVYLDACFSGDSPKGMIVRATSGISVVAKLPEKKVGFTVLTAAGGDQFASWDEDAKMGLFTKNLLIALNGAADGADYGNGDGNVSVGEVQKYLDDEMSYQARRRYNRSQKATIMGDSKTVLSTMRK
jgi:hypothetical protein